MSQENYQTDPRFEAWSTMKFWSCVAKGDGESCWEWVGHRNASGYGVFGYRLKKVLAHRRSYTMENGEIPAGLDIDHLCRNRACVRPSHLRAITHRENMLCGDTFAARNASSTECKNGHPLSGENLRIDHKGSRECMTCTRARWRRKGERRLRDALSERAGR